MLMVISPAKDLDYQSPLSVTTFTQPALLEQSLELMPYCRDLTPAQLSSLMHISDKLAGLNAARFAQWSTPFTPDMPVRLCLLLMAMFIRACKRPA